MGYYKSSIGEIVEGSAPKERSRKFVLTEKQLEAIKTVSGIILGVAVVAGVVVLSAMAPNIFVALDKIFGQRTSKTRWSSDERNRRKITKSLYYLKSKGYIQLIPQGKDYIVKITQKGRKKTIKFQIDSLQIKPPKEWDKKWWMIIADVPIDYRRRADLFRDKLKQLGMYRLQKTVWFYPFDIRDEIDFVSAYYRIDHFVTAMRTDIIDPQDERALKRFFEKKKII